MTSSDDMLWIPASIPTREQEINRIRIGLIGSMIHVTGDEKDRG